VRGCRKRGTGMLAVTHCRPNRTAPSPARGAQPGSPGGSGDRGAEKQVEGETRRSGRRPRSGQGRAVKQVEPEGGTPASRSGQTENLSGDPPDYAGRASRSVMSGEPGGLMPYAASSPV